MTTFVAPPLDDARPGDAVAVRLAWEEADARLATVRDVGRFDLLGGADELGRGWTALISIASGLSFFVALVMTSFAAWTTIGVAWAAVGGLVAFNLAVVTPGYRRGRRLVAHGVLAPAAIVHVTDEAARGLASFDERGLDLVVGFGPGARRAMERVLEIAGRVREIDALGENGEHASLGGPDLDCVVVGTEAAPELLPNDVFDRQLVFVLVDPSDRTRARVVDQELIAGQGLTALAGHYPRDVLDADGDFAGEGRDE